jgi:teichoic acid transport system permease protein
MGGLIVAEFPDASPSRAISERQRQGLSAPDPEDTKAIIDRYQLGRIDTKTPLPRYLRETLQRQQFIRSYARAQVSAANSQNSLGMWWVVLNPTLNAIVYWLVFGVVLNQGALVENYIAFVVIGVFTMEFLAQSLSSGTNAISSNEGLVRALQFPRAVLPLTMVYREFLEQLVAIGVMIAVVLITAEWPDPRWVLFPFVLALQVMFALSIALFAARIGNAITDFKNFVPFIARVWLMLSGAVFALQPTFAGMPQWAGQIMTINPGYVYIELSRSLLMDNYALLTPTGGDGTFLIWALGVLWAVVPLPFAFAFFWAGENTYGKS